METLLSPFTAEPKPQNFFDKYRYWVLAGLLLICGVGIYLILMPPANPLLSADADNVLVAGGGTTASTASMVAPNGASSELVVDVEGGVASPGVYRLPTGSIIEDGIKAAGGFSGSADLGEIARSINRAALVENHSKIYLPKKGDRTSNIVYTNPSSSLPANPLTGLPASLININTGSNAELESLPGIGTILAQRIIDYRLQNGAFTSLEQLNEVPGIGDSLFAKLQGLVTI
ncbi:MAG: ComEA family DNA-binding protein [bacterium]